MRHLRRIEPDAHRVVGAEFLHRADALDVFQLVDIVHGEIVFQKRAVVGPVRRFEREDHRDVIRRFLGRDAQRAYRIRERRISLRDGVLHAHRRHILVRPRQELDIERIRAVRIGRRIHVVEAFDADDLFLDDLRDRLLDDFRIRAGVIRPDRNLRRRDLRVAVDRQHRHTEQPRNRNHERDDDGKYGAVDKEF